MFYYLRDDKYEWLFCVNPCGRGLNHHCSKQVTDSGVVLNLCREISFENRRTIWFWTERVFFYCIDSEIFFECISTIKSLRKIIISNVSLIKSFKSQWECCCRIFEICFAPNLICDKVVFLISQCIEEKNERNQWCEHYPQSSVILSNWKIYFFFIQKEMLLNFLKKLYW